MENMIRSSLNNVNRNKLPDSGACFVLSGNHEDHSTSNPSTADISYITKSYMDG